MSDRDDLARALFVAEADSTRPDIADRLWTNLVRRTPESEWHRQADALLASPWLAEHDHEVRTQWEMTRKPEPIILENIQGEPAATWMARTKADVWDEAAEAWLLMSNWDGPRPTNPYRDAQ